MTVTLVGPVASPGRETRTSPMHASPRPGLRGQQRVLVLDAGIGAPRCARAAVAEALKAWGMPYLVDDATQIASELVANAVAASTPGESEGVEPALTLTLTLTRRGALHLRLGPRPRATAAHRAGPRYLGRARPGTAHR